MGLASLSIDRLIDPEKLIVQVKRLNIESCVLKVIATSENLVLITRPIPAAGMNTALRLTLQPDSRGTDRRLLQNKTLNYLPNLLAWQDAQARGFDDALFFGHAGMIQECSRSNFYIIREDKILTPDESCGLLPGIVRQWLMSEGLVSSGRFTQADILAAESAFVSNSVVGIRRVTEIDGHPFAGHPLLQKIIRRYQRLIIEPAQR